MIDKLGAAFFMVRISSIISKGHDVVWHLLPWPRGGQGMWGLLQVKVLCGIA